MSEVALTIVRVLLASLGLLGLSTFASCASYLNEVTPDAAHRNFVRNLQSYVGEDINANKGWLRTSLRLSSENLGNGLVRYRYGIAGGCIKIFDVDPSTNRIVAVSFEGTVQQCSLPP